MVDKERPLCDDVGGLRTIMEAATIIAAELLGGWHFLRADKMYQKGDDFRPADAAALLGRHVQNMRRQLTAQADSEGVDAPTGAVARRAGSIRPVRVQSRGVAVAMCSDGLNPTTRR